MLYSSSTEAYVILSVSIEYRRWENRDYRMKKDWRIYSLRADFNGLAAKLGVDPVVVRIMRNRGLTEEQDYENFLYGTLNSAHSPEKMLDMELGVDIISASIDEGENIRVVGDYDVDGVTSTYILYDAIKNLGGNVSYDIPHRVRDGYGMNVRIVEDAYNDGVSTIITCDNGIAAVDAVAKAKELGMTVVITDHHEIPPVLPDADAIIDPHQEGDDYPFKDICGAMVAYKFVSLLYRERGESLGARKYLGELALATNCDIMPLINENRIFVREGMKELKDAPSLGLKALIDELSLGGKVINEYHLGFVIGPTINAAGKLGDAKDALELLLSEDEDFAKRRSEELHVLNESRKSQTEQGAERAVAEIRQEEIDGDLQPVDKVLVVYIPGINEGIAGIIAGRLKERFYRPTIVFTDTESDPDILKGSGRSIEAYNMFEKINEHRDMTVKFGGHPLAAGLSIKREDLASFRECLNRDSGLEYRDFVEKLMIDVPMPMSYASMNLAEQLESLAPFGKSNDKPLFAEQDMEILGYEIYGRNMNVMNLKVRSTSGSVHELKFFRPEEFVERINKWFNASDCDKMKNGIRTGCKIDIAYEVGINEYNGITKMQLLLREYEKA